MYCDSLSLRALPFRRRSTQLLLLSKDLQIPRDSTGVKPIAVTNLTARTQPEGTYVEG